MSHTQVGRHALGSSSALRAGCGATITSRVRKHSLRACVCVCVRACTCAGRLCASKRFLIGSLFLMARTHATHTQIGSRSLGSPAALGAGCGEQTITFRTQKQPLRCVCVWRLCALKRWCWAAYFSPDRTHVAHTHTSAAAAAAQLGLTCFTAGQSVSGLQQTQKPKNEQLCQAGQSAKHSCSLFLRFLFCNSGFSGGGSKQSQQPMLLHERWCHIFIRVQ